MPKPTKKVKVIVAPVPKPEAPSAIDSVIGALASLEASTGWAIIVKILNDNIKYLETAILEKIDPQSKEPLTDEEVELLRIKRNINIEVRDTPKNYSAVVTTTGEVPEEFDPYFKTNDDIKQHGKKLPDDER